MGSPCRARKDAPARCVRCLRQQPAALAQTLDACNSRGHAWAVAHVDVSYGQLPARVERGGRTKVGRSRHKRWRPLTCACNNSHNAASSAAWAGTSALPSSRSLAARRSSRPAGGQGDDTVLRRDRVASMGAAWAPRLSGRPGGQQQPAKSFGGHANMHAAGGYSLLACGLGRVRCPPLAAQYCGAASQPRRRGQLPAAPPSSFA